MKLPAQRTVGRLKVFLDALQTGIEGGALRPARSPDTSECKRPASEDA